MKILNLISGTYTPSEAREVLLQLVDVKINFHKLRNLTSQVNYEKPDAASVKRIKELEEMREQIVTLIQEAAEGNRKVEIESILNLATEGEAPAVSFVQEQEVRQDCEV